MNDFLRDFNGITVLGTADVADLLGVSQRFVRELLHEGKLPYQRTSNGFVFPEKAILEYQRKRIRKAKRDPRIRL